MKDGIYIQKRSGKLEKFSQNKTRNGIKKAFESVGLNPDKKTLDEIVNDIAVYDKITVEEIQDAVEVQLMKLGHYATAKSYMLYRQKHAEDRETSERLKFMVNYCNAQNAAQGSKYDANANVDKKNIATLVGELPKEGFIRLNRKILVDRIKTMFGKNEANKYLRLLKKHFIYKNDETSLANYCASITMYPWLLDGTKSIGGNSAAPTNLKSFCGGFINMVFIVSSMLSGACATPEFLMYMNYFLGLEYGKDYYSRANEVVDLSNKKRTIEKVITDCFEQIVYSINQPTGARNFQAVFWNISYYDKYYFESLFEHFRFPDGSAPDWNGLNWLQKCFMKWFNKERTRALLTFPVETMALLTDGNDVKDEEYADFTAEMYSEGHSFFTYMSDKADSLASCCFDGNEVITVFKDGKHYAYMTIEDFVNMFSKETNQYGKNIETGFQTKSYNLSGDENLTDITGVLKKKFSGKLFTFKTGENTSITVTGDHILMVKNKAGEILELPAEKVAENIDEYFLAISD